MCGVVGILSWDRDSSWRREVLSKLLIESQQRGTDATGLMYVRDGNLCVLKDGKPAKEFIQDPRYKKFTEDLPPLVIAHTRGASRGAENGPEDNLNNHPFYNPETGIGIIHNGFIDDDPWRRLAEKQDGTILNRFTGKTDSEAALRILETFVITDAGDMIRNIENTCINMAGSYTLGILRADMPNKMWWVAHTSPLCAAYIPAHRSVLFASTIKILQEVTEERKVSLHFFVSHETPLGSVYNTVNDNNIVEVELLPKHPWVHFKIKSAIKCATQTYEEHKQRGKTEEIAV